MSCELWSFFNNSRRKRVGEKKLFSSHSQLSGLPILRLPLHCCRRQLMAVITEIHSDNEEKPSSSNSSEERKHSSSPPPVSSSPNPFIFWFYFTVCVSLITVLFAAVYSLLPQDEKSWFLGLPDDLRLHYSNGKTIKVQINPGRSPIEIFATDTGPRDAETLVVIHGFGSSSFSFRQLLQALGSNGYRAVAIDLPGSGFSDKSVLEESESSGGVLARLWDVYNEISEKGLFWGFDQLIENGQIPYDQLEMRVSKRKVLKPLQCDAAELSRIIQQVIDSMGLAPVHLILHDTGLGPGAIWASENSGSVRSVTIIDSAPSSGALPLWALEIPVMREFVLGVPLAYYELMRWCCSRSIQRHVADAHRALLKGKGGRRAVVGVGKGLNYSFDLGEWGRQEKVRDVPIQVIWSRNWSEGWTDEGGRVASALPRAKFLVHSGGRWPQEDAVDELAENISKFISSLPKSVRLSKQEPLPEHIQNMFNEASKDDGHHHHHDHHGIGGYGSNHHVHAGGYMDPYGLDHGWGR
ncbi:protein AUXIN RESPONSE 4-like [Aristolochia californica]|uniref:protein AUXIN RESPONSE 4-like n=1 Tax=Aristolochia californica TaxID=171875 RepID=UPI0035E2A23A